MNKRLFFSCGIAALVALTIAPADAAVSLSVLSAPSAREALTDAVATYQKAHSDVTISVTYSGTKVIATEISKGAPVDAIVIGASAMDALNASIDPQMPLYKEHAAIAVTKAAKSKIKDARDLAKPGVRIGKGVSGSFAGDFQKTVTTKLESLYGKDYAAKYDANATVSRLDTGKLIALLDSDGADAAIVFAAEIDTKKFVEVNLPPEATVSIAYSVASVKASTHAADAKAFVAWLVGPEAQAIFKSHHHDPK